MPAERLSMLKIRDVLRLRFGSRLSEREIGRSLLLSNGSVNSYLQLVVWRAWTGPCRPTWTTDVGAPAVAAASDRRDRSRSSQPDWTLVDKEMRRKGVTMALLWEEYRAAHPDGFGYSWFCENYAAFKSRLRPSMRQSHGGGEKVFVDFAGDTIDVVDPSGGEVRPMKLFVAVMGASRMASARVSTGRLCFELHPIYVFRAHSNRIAELDVLLGSIGPSGRGNGLIADRVGVVALVAKQFLRPRIAKLHQRIIALDLMRLTAGQFEHDGRPLLSVRRWILVEKPPRERPRPLDLDSPFYPGCRPMRPHDGRVDGTLGVRWRAKARQRAKTRFS